jgi:succinate dehydrogenase/fumarate reductase-like Fe-S protein
MPKVEFAGATVECPEGANLRTVLLRARLPLYNGVARAIHCRGFGTCGTCAVRIEGPVCQTRVLGDVAVTKYDGLWGQGDEPVR